MPKSANEAGNKETINLALVSMSLVKFFALELLQNNSKADNELNELSKQHKAVQKKNHNV